MRRACFIFFVFFSICSKAQIVRTPVTATYTQFGAYSINHIDAFSFTSNQAALAHIKNAAAGIYGEKRFLLKELSVYNGVFVLPTSSGNFGIKGAYFGDALYNETQIGLAYGRSLGKKVSVGVQFNYYNIKAGGIYGNAAAFNFEGGAVLHLTYALHAGIHIYNPVGTKFGKNSEEELPSIYKIGLGYETSEKLYLSTEIEKQEDVPVNVNAGLQYRFNEMLAARAGVSTSTSVYYFGIGVELKQFRLDATASVHQQLGISPGLLLLFNLKKKR